MKHQGWIHALPAVHTCVNGVNGVNGIDSSTDLVDGDGETLPPDGLLVTAMEGWGSEGDDAT